METNKISSASGGQVAKVAILALTCGRPEMTRRTWERNLYNAGHPFDLFWWDNGSSSDDLHEIGKIIEDFDVTWGNFSKENVGIAPAFNVMFKIAFNSGYDYVFTMGNDILENDDYLKIRIEAAQAIENTGVVAFKCQGACPQVKLKVNGIDIEQGQVIANYLITKQAFDTIGGFCCDYGIYGPIDLDYCDRLHASDIRAYYLIGHSSDHIGEIRKNPVEYQAAKKRSLDRSWQTYAHNKEKYKNKEYLYQLSDGVKGMGGGNL